MSGRRERQEEENMLLYVGLGMSAVGLAVTFVGRSSVSIRSITYNMITRYPGDINKGSISGFSPCYLFWGKN